MLNTKQKEALEKIAQRLNKNNTEWILIASANLALQGMDFNPADLDIVVPVEQKEMVLGLFSECQISAAKEHSNKEGVGVKINFEDVDVEFCFDYEHSYFLKLWRDHGKILIDLNGTKVPGLKLSDEAMAYEYLGRSIKAQTIRDFLKNL